MRYSHTSSTEYRLHKIVLKLFDTVNMNILTICSIIAFLLLKCFKSKVFLPSKFKQLNVVFLVLSYVPL